MFSNATISDNHGVCGYKSLEREGFPEKVECLKDAKEQKIHGVAVVVRKGAFMVGKELFEKNGFAIVESAAPDFELMVKKI